MRKRAVLFAVIAFLLGHISFIMQDFKMWLLSLCAVILLLTLAGLKELASIRQLLLLLALFLIGSTQRYIVDVSNVTALPLTQIEAGVKAEAKKTEVKADGVIISEVEIDGNIVDFTFQTKQIEIENQLLHFNKYEKFMVRITLQEQDELEQAAAWRRGIHISLQGTIERPPEASNIGMFNYRSYLHKKGIHWLWKSKSASSVQLLEARPHISSNLLHRIDELRYKLAAPLDLLFNEIESGYLKGLILGIRSDLDPEQFRSFSTLGLTHILAISGLHVAVFMYIVTALLKALRCSKEHIITVLLVAIPCYVAITGASPSVLRAGMMAMLGLLAAKAGTLKDGLHIIAVVAGLLVLWRPYLIHDISFQLSFIVTLGLIVGVPAIQQLFPSPKGWKWLMDVIAVTVVAQIISFPLSIYYFNQFHLLSITANLILVPFISMLVMPLASLSLLLGHLSITIAKPISNIVHWCNELSFTVVEMFSEVNLLYTIWPSPSLLWILLWYIIWFYLFYYWRNVRLQHNTANLKTDEETAPIEAIDELVEIYSVKAKQSWWLVHRVKLISTFLIAFMLIHGYQPHLLDRTAYISFLDVGQGDASLIRTPSGKYVLIDGGGTIQFGEQEEWKQRKEPFETGKNVLLPLLMKRGVQQLDTVIITHLDTDHIGGLREVIKAIPIKEIWWNGSYKSSREVDQLFELILDRGISLYTPLIGERLYIDRHTMIEVLWPLEEIPEHIEQIEEQNEQSLVFLLTVYSTTVLYTGDINSITEEMIITKHYQSVQEGESDPLPNIQVMKAAHHGSRYSTQYNWLSYVQPQATVISAGRNNVYGHPHPDVIKRLEQYHSLVWRTDIEGEVQLAADKHHTYFVKWN